MPKAIVVALGLFLATSTAKGQGVVSGTYQVDLKKGEAQLGNDAFVDKTTGWVILTEAPCKGTGKAALVWNGQSHTIGNHLVFSTKAKTLVCHVLEVLDLRPKNGRL